MNKTTETLFDVIEQMPEEERIALLGMLEKNLPRRKHRRQPFPVVVDYSADNRFYKDFIHNISKGGIFMETRVPFPVGTEISMTFPMPKKKQSLKVTGTVVRVSSEGIGIKFQKSAEMEKILSHL